jgi:hypothetical protein
MAKAVRKHLDGSLCPEGTRRIHARFSACCEEFTHRTRACYFDIRYEWWPKLKNWFVVISDEAGGGGIAINFCPHCGRKLKGQKRSGRWYEV